MLLSMSVLSPVTAPMVATQCWNQISSCGPVIGSAWIISSAFYTTFSTTGFLKYQGSINSNTNNKRRLPLPLARRKIVLPRDNPMEKHVKPQSRFWFEKLKADRPALLTLYRFSGSLLLGLLFPNPMDFITKWRATLELMPKFFVPALCLFLANYFNSISLDKLGISLTYTTKCGIPIFTVLTSILVYGQSACPKLSVWFSLLPIVFGIACASWNSSSWNRVGFICAIISCTSQATLNVMSKKVLHEVAVKGPEAQRIMVCSALACMVLLSIVKSVVKKKPEEKVIAVSATDTPHPTLALTSMAVTAYHFEYVLSFMFVSLTEPITYALCDAMRRLSIILCGKAMFGGEKLTDINKLGIGLAIVGAAMYAICK